MPNSIEIMLTIAGKDALVDAQNGTTEAIEITQVGLTESDFAAAPTLTALPGEFKRISAVSGQSVDEFTIHMTAIDNSTDVYDLRGIGLYLSDGTLFGVYGQPDPLFTKVTIATFLQAFDIIFGQAITGDITFGNTEFLYPPATEIEKGVARIATQALVDAGVNDTDMVTALKLATRLVPIINDIATNGTGISNLGTALADLADNTITGSGLVTGGGSIDADRVLNVAAASFAQLQDKSANNVALTPASFAGYLFQAAATGYTEIPGTEDANGNPLVINHGRFTAAANGSTPITYPHAYSVAAYAVVTDGGLSNASNQDNYVNVLENTISTSGFTAFNGQAAFGANYIAIGR